MTNISTPNLAKYHKKPPYLARTTSRFDEGSKILLDFFKVFFRKTRQFDVLTTDTDKTRRFFAPIFVQDKAEIFFDEGSKILLDFFKVFFRKTRRFNAMTSDTAKTRWFFASIFVQDKAEILFDEGSMA